MSLLGLSLKAELSASRKLIRVMAAFVLLLIIIVLVSLLTTSLLTLGRR